MVSWCIKKKGWYSTRRPREYLGLLVDQFTRRPGDFLLVGYHIFFKINQETKKFFCPPGGLIHQETRRFSPGGVPYFFNPPGDQEILLFSWWTTPPRNQVIFSWWVLHFFLIHQETKKISWSPGGSIHQETRRFSPGGVPHIF